jgi:hypothetical protein
MSDTVSAWIQGYQEIDMKYRQKKENSVAHVSKCAEEYEDTEGTESES